MKENEEYGVLSDCDKQFLKSKGYETMTNIGSSYDHLVFKARTASGQVVAVKYLQITNKRKQKYLEREIQITDFLRDNPHKCIVKVFDNIRDETNNRVFTIMELGTGGDLITYFERRKWTRIDDHLAKYWFDQLLSAVKWLHDHNIAHRDIKADNVVMFPEGDTFRLKLTDLEMAIFGVQRIGRFTQTIKCNTVCGSIEYAAPEIFNAAYDPFMADIYSLGVVLHIFVAGISPFRIYGSQLLQLSDRINRTQELKQNPCLDFPKKSNSSAQALVRQMLDPKPDTRIKLTDIFNSEWMLTGGDQESKHFWRSVQLKH
ncbi:uncharacterized protein LOC128952968 [Oppia nitens]|uniref:uncharacterized protein LOC128952968 n=1 Tax=Oppia nitens TaxID=1686743 RepID=UPI0023DB2F67|nr:uncharacterized protein LOC128952968 [Oppia nitens]